LIGGESVAEPDFASLHPQLLYALHGIELCGDAYSVPDVNYSRKLIKEAWMRAINARSRSIALASMKEEFQQYSRLQLDALLEAIEGRHQAIAGSLYRCPAEKLQFIDSELLLMTLARCRGEGITGLPIHDSIIVPQSAGASAERSTPDVATRRPGRPSIRAMARQATSAAPSVPQKVKTARSHR
jgi:hypothetical protein